MFLCLIDWFYMFASTLFIRLKLHHLGAHVCNSYQVQCYYHTLELLPCTAITSILPTPMESISSATRSIRRLPDMPSTLCRLKKLFALSIEKLTILAGQVTIWAKILLMPCGFCIGVLFSMMISSSLCVRMWPLLFKVPGRYKHIILMVFVWFVGILVISCHFLTLGEAFEGSVAKIIVFVAHKT